MHQSAVFFTQSDTRVGKKLGTGVYNDFSRHVRNALSLGWLPMPPNSDPYKTDMLIISLKRWNVVDRVLGFLIGLFERALKFF